MERGTSIAAVALGATVLMSVTAFSAMTVTSAVTASPAIIEVAAATSEAPVAPAPAAVLPTVTSLPAVTGTDFRVPAIDRILRSLRTGAQADAATPGRAAVASSPTVAAPERPAQPATKARSHSGDDDGAGGGADD